MPLADVTDAPLEFACPRCHASGHARASTGPAAPVAVTLRATQGGEARVVEATAYEPKMNVTPNAVALKD